MDIIQKTVAQAIKLLNASKAQYIIILPSGEVHEAGGLQLVTPKPVKVRKPMRNLKYPWGTMVGIYGPHLSIEVGDVATIPCPAHVKLEDLAASTSAGAGARWGAGNSKTYANDKTNAVEILRMG